MSNMKSLKIIDWFIKVPDISDNFEDKIFYSTIFSLTVENKSTLWKVGFNLNDQNENKVIVYLQRLSDPDDIKFDFLFRPSVANSTFAASTKFLKNQWACKISEGKGPSWGIYLMSSKVLIENLNRLCIDGVLHLHVAIDLVVTHKIHMVHAVAPTTEAFTFGNSHPDIDFKPDFKVSNNIFDMITTSDSDILIKTNDGTILKAHTTILSKKSTVFASMFNIDMEEAASKSVDIIDFSGPVMRELLRFVYFGNVQNLDEISMELFKAAKVYEIADLPEICLKSVSAGLNHENVIDIVQFAGLYDLDQLFNDCCEKLHRLRYHQSIQQKLTKLSHHLLVAILDQMNMEMMKTQTHVVVETCTCVSH